ncbi:thiamine phosphate synthase [Vibrio sp. 10N.286.49.B3]|uniref:thiamine phosphate synthase n=1 Tax=Vibrio sp. 10N.286.49.B3 TaxID=1880855 RepID=UPI000CB0F756|nr:thiamine phosphate synthase [Vibrio sp. 10N.286.49.B3]PMH38683.1 thiamine phosphate synthase [Vibrio sp. 10N.286.49.B3]
MEMNLQIPADYIDLKKEVETCLALAKQQGFDCHAVEITQSESQVITIGIDKPLSLAILDSASMDCIDDSNIDWLLDYNHSTHLSLSAAATLLAQQSKRIVLGLGHDNSFYDIWLHPLAIDHNEKRATVFSTLGDNYQQTRHSAWLITLLALEFPIEDALVLSRAAMNVSRETWVKARPFFPTPVIECTDLNIHVGWSTNDRCVAFPKLTKPSLGLYPVVDSVEWIERLLELGIKTVQLRIKDPHCEDLEQQIERSIRLGEQYQAQVFINDYWQLAIKHRAFGVHLGQEDIECSNLTELSEAGICLGLSTHGYYELLRISQVNPSYIALGHIFPTTTKDMPSKPQGLTRLKLYQQLIDTMPYQTRSEQEQNEALTVGFPTVAIGGIDQSTAPLVWQCGVSSLAVVRAITLSANPRSVIDEFGEIMNVSRETTTADLLEDVC